MYTNRELFKMFMMEEYGFNNNVDFDKLRKYLLFLKYNKYFLETLKWLMCNVNSKQWVE